jgi:DNA-binding SARP family transcriptional activator
MPPAPTNQPVAGHDFVLRTLGTVALCRPDDQTLILGPGKPVALLAYLAIAPARTATREHLIELLWADADLERARHALRQTLWQIKHVTGGEPFSGGREEVTLDLPLDLDRDRFLAHIVAGELEAAVTSYTGPFFPTFASPGGAAFEHWADLEREQLRTTFARTAEQLARRQLADGRFRDAIATARHLPRRRRRDPPRPAPPH